MPLKSYSVIFTEINFFPESSLPLRIHGLAPQALKGQVIALMYWNSGT